MKVSILSMQRVDNMGSLLQAYALYSFLRDEGNDVHFIDIKIEGNDEIISEAKYSHKEENDPGKRLDKYFLIRALNRIKEKKQREIYEAFRINELNIERYQPKGKDDICIIGSDEVFNCLSPSPWGLSSQLFGNVDNTNRVITYAACCGATQYNDLPGKAKEIICKSLKRITAFSVRDDNTAQFVQCFGYHNIEKHLDPVLIYDFSEEAERYKGIERRLPKNYCILYSYHNRIHKKDEIYSIKRFVKNNNLELITVGQSQFWISRHYVLHPFELITAFKNARYVITDTFHGCILAAKYSQDFSVLARKSNENKLLDLVETIGAGDHLVKSLKNLEMHENVNKLQILSVLEREKSRTEDYFRKMLNI